MAQVARFLRGNFGRDAFHRVPILSGEISRDAVEPVPTDSVAALPRCVCLVYEERLNHTTPYPVPLPIGWGEGEERLIEHGDAAALGENEPPARPGNRPGDALGREMRVDEIR